jgi:hypothetical protein
LPYARDGVQVTLRKVPYAHLVVPIASPKTSRQVEEQRGKLPTPELKRLGGQAWFH